MNDNIDLGNMKSRDIGNLTSKALVDFGKQVVSDANPNQEVDYGDLPSRELSNLGKEVVINQLTQ
jgi:hypothetical protein